MEVIKSLLEKISNFFDLFDISYLVSGIATLGIIYFTPDRNGLSYNLPDGLNNLWWFIICYSLGLASTSLGRRLNQKLSNINKKDHLRKYLHFEKTLIDSKLDLSPSFTAQLVLAPASPRNPYKYTEGSLKNVYRLMWATLRERKDVPESLSLMRRYWLNSSTMDGLSISSLIAVIISIYSIMHRWSNVYDLFHLLSFYFSILSIIMFLVFSSEANRFRRYQVEELIGTYIYVKNRTVN